MSKTITWRMLTDEELYEEQGLTEKEKIIKRKEKEEHIKAWEIKRKRMMENPNRHREYSGSEQERKDLENPCLS